MCVWSTCIKDYHVAVYKLASGKYLGAYGLKPIYDPWNTSTTSQQFDTIEEAFKFVGWPVGIVPLPELKQRERVKQC